MAAMLFHILQKYDLKRIFIFFKYQLLHQIIEQVDTSSNVSDLYFRSAQFSSWLGH
jgi:hypothetical protein